MSYSIYEIVSSSIESFDFSFFILMPLFIFSYLTTLARISGSILNSHDSEYLCHKIDNIINVMVVDILVLFLTLQGMLLHSGIKYSLLCISKQCHYAQTWC